MFARAEGQEHERCQTQMSGGPKPLGGPRDLLEQIICSGLLMGPGRGDMLL